MILAVPVLSAPGWANRARRVQLGEELVGTRKGSTPRNGLTVTQPPVYAAQVSRTANDDAPAIFVLASSELAEVNPPPCQGSAPTARPLGYAPLLRVSDSARTQRVSVYIYETATKMQEIAYRHPQLWPMCSLQNEPDTLSDAEWLM